ncbi:protein ACCELERATED CELL DEATH 6-like isoform X1 [Diospyros lotus]|uniref:protein ACCELERATED CELL DEATH 6-like isoform X1 n=1 Tax=Diospyros lotus TaxID=55363 RepID=UPI0022508A52|nr:protein ACCELERATED CELL DEATH 6-like isoform X1 [Diospyros lotus]
MAASGTSSTAGAPSVSHHDAFRALLNRRKGHLPQVLVEYLGRPQGDHLGHIDVDGNTVLHFLAIDGDESAFKELSEKGLITSEMQRIGNFRGNTALHEAARFGHLSVVKIMLEKEEGLALARNNLGETPLYVAVAAGKKDVYDFVKQKLVGKENDVTRRNDGSSLLHAAVVAEYYDLALEIVKSFPRLVGAHDEKGITAMSVLASKPLSFKSGSAYSFINLGSRSFIPVQLIRCLIYLCIIPPMDQRAIPTGDEENPPRKNCSFLPQPMTELKWKLISGYRWILRRVSILIRGVDDIKQKHTLAILLAKRLIAKETDWSHYTYGESSTEPWKNQAQTDHSVPLHPIERRPNLHFAAVTTASSPRNNRMRNPLIQAVENSIEELVEAILERFPDAAYTVDRNGKNILHIAVEQKDKLLYDYLKTKVRKDMMLRAIDNRGNTILHLATNEGTSPRILLGHLNQMAWDVCWFKRIWYDSCCHFQYHRNLDGKTAREIFQEKHVTLRENAEKALKDMNNGLMLVSTLIGTVNYATLFSIPGGYVDDNESKSFGRPKFFSTKKEDQLLVFLWYTGVALFSSVIALASMLVIQLSRFTDDDFFMTLPLKYVGALAALFISAIFTVAACVETYLIIEINVNPYYLMWPLVGFLILISIDVVYLTFDYMYFAIRCAFSFTGQEM